MKIAIVTGHTPNYNTMAEVTLPAKVSYAARHGYNLFVQTDNFLAWPERHIGYEKCYYLSEIMKEHPEIEWFWWNGCDCLLTNLDVKLETLIDNDYHFIVTKDDEGIGADVFLVRNTPEGREYIEHLKTQHEPSGTEQGHMWDDEHNPKWRAITKYLPQNSMNSYVMKWYPHKRRLKDLFGQRQNWAPGDLMLQAVTGFTPGLNPQQVYEWKLNILKTHIKENA
jgi:hypothetical protein